MRDFQAGTGDLARTNVWRDAIESQIVGPRAIMTSSADLPYPKIRILAVDQLFGRTVTADFPDLFRGMLTFKKAWIG